MAKGKLRNEIIDECPEEFKDTLKSWIDNLETELGYVLSKLDVSSLDDLTNIIDAQNALDVIIDELY